MVECGPTSIISGHGCCQPAGLRVNTFEAGQERDGQCTHSGLQIEKDGGRDTSMFTEREMGAMVI